jgi:hypothetical protein
VHFEVRVLLASNPTQPTAPPGAPPGKQNLAPAGTSGPADAQMDERLKQILPRLRKLFRYSDYAPLDHHQVDVEFGASKRLPAAGDRWLEVAPQDLQGKSVRMKVRLLNGEKPVMTSNIVAAPGAPAVVGGPRHGTGVLIIILWADPISPVPAGK